MNINQKSIPELNVCKVAFKIVKSCSCKHYRKKKNKFHDGNGNETNNKCKDYEKDKIEVNICIVFSSAKLLKI